MEAEIAKGAAILVALAVTIGVGAFGNPDLSDLARPSWQPSNAAFSIWAIIYTGLAIGGVFQLNTAVASRSNPWSVALLCVSLLSSAAWLVTVRRAVELSAAFIVVAFLTAAVSLGLNPPLRDPCNVADRFVAHGPALLTGWLSLAAPLGVNLAVQARGGVELPAWAALPSTLAAAGLGAISGTPEVGAVLIWASLFSARTALSNILAIVGLASALAAVTRSLAASTVS